MHSKIFQSRLCGLPLFVLLLGLAVGLVACEGETEENSKKESSWGFELSRELMSPYCPGRTLADCPSSQADDLKIWIYDQEAQGRTREEVEQALIAHFGEAMRGAPQIWIDDQEAQGRTREEVEQDLLARFGEKMLGAPRAKGFSLAAYWIPAVLFVLGGGIAWRFLRRQKLQQAQTAAAAPTPVAPLTPELSQILEEEMRE